MDKDFRPVLAELATGVWRLRGKLDGARPDEDVRKLLRSVARQLDSMTDALADAGVQVQSHTGEFFDAGQSVEVIAFEASEAVQRETVAETVTPTVYVDDRMVQMGQIIVATPADSTAAQELSEGR
ncbi:hypothetical protein LTV02_03040 [Nocardia yamanashiensis]|uniref:hypothetical protein n=1 Tax=Nocardia yamanashiensis TaxID=209247 RepID=UPI001E39D5F6|nr:hypothetical protein [Nocardia yamanashiensis]UGT42411.1 hypothetical protein LTV02_03040 [Nocardia yamanashiensis]